MTGRRCQTILQFKSKKQTKNNNLRDGWGVEKLSTLTVLNMFVVFRLSILNSEYF